ncbi:MAG: hypothetical protein JXB38_03295 [Anaerolineales bacterium]|nr:hypothetical protein [Anaerolineales bacterium]
MRNLKFRIAEMVYLVFVAGAALVVSCNTVDVIPTIPEFDAAKTETPTQNPTTQKPVPTSTNAITQTNTPSPTAALTITPSNIPLQRPLKDILVNVANVENPWECYYTDFAEIWMITEPYDTGQLLLSHAELNYYLPTWSPGGEYIAFVESKRGYVYDSGMYSETKGTERIWMMRPDGSDRVLLADTLERLDFVGADACYRIRYVSDLTWSPDSQYLGVTYIYSEQILDFYLIDVEKKTIDLVFSDMDANVVWISNSQLISINDNGIIYKDINANNEMEKPFQFPSEEFNPFRPVWDSEDSQLIITFRDSKTGIYSIWTLDLGSGEWTKLFTLSSMDTEFNGSGGAPDFGIQWAVSWGTTGSDPLFFINAEHWQMVGTLPKKIDGKWLNSQSVCWSTDQLGNEFVNFLTGDADLYVVNPNMWPLEYEQIVSLAYLLEDQDANYILDYAWQP